VKAPKEILLSGRLAKIVKFYETLKTRLSDIAPVHRINGLPMVHIAKEAAQGAAIIANGLADGKFKPLIETMKLLEAKGTVLDYIYFQGIEKYKKS
ncbi:MAG: DUF1464 family protein, partial [Candidatus Helarchaeota archaeon]